MNFYLIAMLSLGHATPTLLSARQVDFLYGTMCNCNNPTTKMTYVQPLCDEIQGEDSFGYFYGLEQVEQHMCRTKPGSGAAAVKVFTNDACRELYGEGFNAYCGTSKSPASEHYDTCGAQKCKTSDDCRDERYGKCEAMMVGDVGLVKMCCSG